MKEFLSRAGYPFTDRNVEADDQAYEELLALGWRAVPVTIIDGVAVLGFDEPRLRERLTAGAGPPPDR